MTYGIRPATSDDVDVLIGLRLEAEDWLRDAGIRQWTEDYAEQGHQVLREAIENRHTWVVTSPDGQTVGTVTLAGPDLDFWRPEEDPDVGLYVYKMIVARAHAGRGLGDAILNWASHRAADDGRSWVRLDCRRDNHRLHAYYLARGFEHVRTEVNPGRPTNSGALFQRKAGTEFTAPIPAGIERASIVQTHS